MTLAAAAVATWMQLAACERVQAVVERQVHAKAKGKPPRETRTALDRMCERLVAEGND